MFSKIDSELICLSRPHLSQNVYVFFISTNDVQYIHTHKFLLRNSPLFLECSIIGDGTPIHDLISPLRGASPYGPYQVHPGVNIIYLPL